MALSIIPTHNHKMYINDPPKLPEWKEFNIRAWLGSGIKDCDGKEFFEGDIVDVDIKRFCQFLYPHPDSEVDPLYSHPPHNGIAFVVYQYGTFNLYWEEDNYARKISLEIIQNRNFHQFFKIIGHIADRDDLKKL